MYARAKEAQYETWAAEVLSLAHSKPRTYLNKNLQPVIDPGWVQLIRLQIDSRKWLLSKLCRSKYGGEGENTESADKKDTSISVNLKIEEADGTTIKPIS